MASTTVAVGAQLSLSLSLPRKGVKTVAGHFTVCSAPCVVSATARLGGRPQQPSSIGTSQESKKRFSSIIVKASEQADPSEQASELLKSLQESWEKVDDKLAIGGLGFAGLILLWASAGLLGALDKLPFIPAFFEFVGILFSGWFIYRYLLFKPDREELLKIIDEAKGKITGGKKRPTNGTLKQTSATDDVGTGENGEDQASKGVRSLGRDDDRKSFEWEVEGALVAEWRGFSDSGSELNGGSKPNGTARPDVSV